MKSVYGCTRRLYHLRLYFEAAHRGRDSLTTQYHKLFISDHET